MAWLLAGPVNLLQMCGGSIRATDEGTRVLFHQVQLLLLAASRLTLVPQKRYAMSNTWHLPAVNWKKSSALVSWSVTGLDRPEGGAFQAEAGRASSPPLVRLSLQGFHGAHGDAATRDDVSQSCGGDSRVHALIISAGSGICLQTGASEGAEGGSRESSSWQSDVAHLSNHRCLPHRLGWQVYLCAG